MNKKKVLIGVGVLALLFLFLRKKKAVVVEEEMPQEEGGAPSGGGGGGGGGSAAPKGAEKSAVATEIPVAVVPVFPLGSVGTTQNITQTTTNVKPSDVPSLGGAIAASKPNITPSGTTTSKPLSSRPVNATTRPLVVPVASKPATTTAAAAKFSDFSYVDGGDNTMLDSLL
jgi:hypothetical protein